MKARTFIIIGIIAASVSLLAVIGFIPTTSWLAIHPCQLEIGIPHADALIAHQTIGQIYDQADIVAVGTITDSSPGCSGDRIVTRMTVGVKEYLKNPQSRDSIRLESIGGSIAGVGGMWMEDQKIFERGEHVLLFLYDPTQDDVYKIGPYSTAINAKKISGNDLIQGIELRADQNQITLEKGQSGNISLVLDSFFGYDKKTPVSVASFSTYDSATDDFTSYENPSDLEEFGIHIKSDAITPVVNEALHFEIPITVDADAKEGKYFVYLVAQTQDETDEILFASWKTSSKQIQIIIEK